MEREETVTIIISADALERFGSFLDRYLAVCNRALDIQEKMLGDIDGE